ncbi:MAG: hypothetical protein ACJAV1_002766 [Paraglaciecola sp.]|jgi:hypothetical protein
MKPQITNSHFTQKTINWSGCCSMQQHDVMQIAILRGVVGVGQDITELDSYRLEMETKIEERTRELDTIFTLSPDGFVLANGENNMIIILWNMPILLEMKIMNNAFIFRVRLNELLTVTKEQCMD